MPKFLKVKFPEKCIGCELCVMNAQAQLKKFGLEGAPIRIFRKTDSDEEVIPSEISFSIEMDPRVNELDVEKISRICPTGVFSIDESEEDFLE